MRVKSQLLEAQFEILSSAPTSPKTGQIYYDTTLTTARIYSGSGWINMNNEAAAVGSTGAFDWVEDPSGPFADIEFNEKVFKFQDGLSQPLKLYYRVPGNYVAGNQINIQVACYTPTADGSSTFLLTSTTTLIQKATATAVDSTANQHSSINTAVSIGATANKYESVSMDLTDGNGQINGTAVAAGDLLKIQISRSVADTDTADIRLIPHATEVSLA